MKKPRLHFLCAICGTLLVATAHGDSWADELGHVLCGEGHPDQGGGRAPLPGTDHSKRLMSTLATRAAGAKLLVKTEWDRADGWLFGRLGGDN